jgi:hypothetical protein
MTSDWEEPKSLEPCSLVSLSLKLLRSAKCGDSAEGLSGEPCQTCPSCKGELKDDGNEARGLGTPSETEKTS